MISYRDVPSRKFGIEIEVVDNINKGDLSKIIRKCLSDNKVDRKVVTTLGKKQGWALSVANDYWHVKNDSTAGWEIASYVGSGEKDLFDICRVPRYLSAIGAESNKKCGFHIHVEVKDFDKNMMSNLISNWLVIEKYILQICHPSRRENHYCKSIRDYYSISEETLNSPYDTWDSFGAKNPDIFFNPYKKFTLNTVGFKRYLIDENERRATVEFRMPECLLDEMHVRNWVLFCINFVESCRQNYVEEGIENFPKSLSTCVDVDEILKNCGFGCDFNKLIPGRNLMMVKIWFLRKLARQRKYLDISKQAKEKIKFLTSLNI